MKARRFALFSVILPVIAFSGENLITNGDFSKGSYKWRGNENIEFETPDEKNKICVIEVSKNKDIKFDQPIDLFKLNELTISYRVKKSPDYKGSGYHIFVKRTQRGGVKFNPKVPNDNKWHKVKFKISELRDYSSGEIRFVIKKGQSGSLAFDDIVVIGQ